MPEETLGSIYSLLCALSWGAAVVLFKRSGDAMGPVALNMFKNVVGLALMVVTCLALGTPLPETDGTFYAAMILSGAVGIGLADSLLFAALNILGASRQAIVDCLYAPSVVVCAFLMLGEELAPMDALGAALILGAVVLVVGAPQGGARPARLGIGVVYSSVSIVLMALSVVAIKPLLEQHDVLLATTLRTLGGVLGLLAGALVHRPTRESVAQAFVPDRSWRFALPGAVVGTYVALLFWLAGFKYAPAGVAAILNQTSTLFIVLLAAMFLNERLTPRMLLAVASALGGVVVVVKL